MHLTLVLLLCSTPATVEPPADAPVVTHTAVLETPEHTFVSRGEGLWLPRQLALDRARELAGLRARLALQDGDWSHVAPAWSVVAGFVVDQLVKVAVAIIAAVKACDWGLCPPK